MVWYGGGCQITIEFICKGISMLFHSEKSYGGGGGWHCNYRVKLQVQVSQRFEIDLGPGPELDNKRKIKKSGSHSESPSECYSESHLKCHLENHMRKSCEYLPFGLDWMKKCENHHSNIFLLWGGSGALRVQHYGWLIDLKCM